MHDALLIEADEDCIEEHAALCKAAMQEASRLVLLGFELRVEHEIIRFPDRFPVGNGKPVWDEVVKLLSEQAA